MMYRIEDLKEIAERFGEVRDVYIPKNHYTQQPRGFAFIEFTDPKACEDASYDMQGLEIEGKPVCFHANCACRAPNWQHRHVSLAECPCNCKLNLATCPWLRCTALQVPRSTRQLASLLPRTVAVLWVDPYPYICTGMRLGWHCIPKVPWRRRKKLRSSGSLSLTVVDAGEGCILCELYAD